MKKRLIVLGILLPLGLAVAPVGADDTSLFMNQVPPNVLLLLDMSGSMNLGPSGDWADYPNRRIDIARDIIFDLLDDNDSGLIGTTDQQSLNIRLGYMRFRTATNNDDGDPRYGTIKVLAGIGSSYSTIWNWVNSSAEYDASGGTPLAASLAEAKTHFTTYVNPSDTAVACRQKSVILITDGSDTYACSGTGVEDAPDMYKRRLLTVQEAKRLYDAGIEVFVVGFGGTVSDALKRTLNWAAKYGGTDNPLEINSGDPDAFSLPAYDATCSATSSQDPANYNLSGYAFLAEDAANLRKAIKTIAKNIQEKSYSFTAPSNPSIRVVDNYVAYISSFIPNSTPYWKGNLRAYRLNEDGTLPVDQDGNPINSNLLWDGQEKLSAISPGSRNILTVKNGLLTAFSRANILLTDLDVPTEAEAGKLIDHIRGIDSYDVDKDSNTTETREWKLGDIFHSNAVVVGEPSRFFEDTGFSDMGGFYDTNKNRTKITIAGANDGMLHAFGAETGVETWAFIPGSLLKNLKSMTSVHTYYVDSSPRAADVWFYSDATDTTKNASEWKTVLVSGLRKGGKFYFALDITDTVNPKYLWEFPKSTDAVTLGKVGESWSEPALGRVKVEVGSGLSERWVAFIGGGFDYTNNTGKAFFVVDLKTGDILKEFSGLEGMNYALAAPPTAVDADADGFIDKVYIGDLYGQMWVFDVSFDEGTKKSNSLWQGKRLFAPNENHPIYYPPAVAFDPSGNAWVYFGTGDREYPTDITHATAERFYGIKDDGISPFPRTEANLLDKTSTNTFEQPNDPYKGWYIRLQKTAETSEKVLAKPVVFNQLVYFTTYAFTQQASNPCSVLGEGRLYILEYRSAGGAMTVDDYSDLKGPTSERSKKTGEGIPSSPVIRVDQKGRASVIIGFTSAQAYSAKAFSPVAIKDIVYWREIIR